MTERLSVSVVMQEMQDSRDVGSVPGLGRTPEEENGNLNRYSCLSPTLCSIQSRAALFS